ncbi:hypothetical protein CB0940_00209 [Cercospora beticola]|uniref:Uncharacterized protein n=2 Tax=Cercospora beticola TaxID=122368 RepID=A0A2G5I824_CERBT|nr:hypothetical protein CB0940_00209 [Cercospora beticola]PIB00925.1 hypothetical protein CB0940_00209 [Cercospora beticola]
MRCRASIGCSGLLVLYTSLTKAQRQGLLEARTPSPRDIEPRDFWSDLQTNHIDSVANAAQALVNQKFPGETPTNVNLQTVAWPSTYQIGGTTYTAIPTVTQASTSMTSESTTSTDSSSIASSTSVSTTESSTSVTSSTSTPTPTEVHKKNHINDGDRKVAIALGVIFILAGIVAALLVLLAAWSRKRRTGSYFKPARCPDCTSSGAPSVLFGVDRNSGAWRAEHNEQTHSWLAGARAFGSVRSGGTNSIRANFPEMTGSAERLPIPVEPGQALATHHDFPLVGDSCSSRGNGRLQKSRPTTREGFIELHDAPAGTAELSGDDLNTINELEGDSADQIQPITRRLSSFPFMFSSSVRGDSDAATTPGGMASRSNSGNTRTTASELDANESVVRRRHSSLTKLTINPVVMANVTGSETNLRNSSNGFGITVSDLDHDKNLRPSEMDGESPTRRASTWRELQRSTFTVDDLKAEIESFNALLVSGSEGATTSVATSPTAMDDDRRASVLSPSSTGAWSEARDTSLDETCTAPTDYTARTPSNASQSAKSSSSSGDGSPTGYVSALRPASRLPDIKTTEVFLPPRPPQVLLSATKPSSIHSVSSISTLSTPRLPAPPTPSERDTILNRLKQQTSSPRIAPTNTSPAWAPAGAYAMAPIWRKKRPAPLTPDFLLPSANSPRLVSPLSGGGGYGTKSPLSALASSFEDLSKTTTLRAPDPTAYPSSEALASPASASSPRRPRPRPLSPDWLPETLRAGNGARKGSADSASGDNAEPKNDNSGPVENLGAAEEDHILSHRHSQYFRRCSRLDPGSPYSYTHAPVTPKFQSGGKAIHYPTSEEVKKFSFDDGSRESSSHGTEVHFEARDDGDDGWKPSGSDLEGGAGRWALMA